MKKPLLKPGKNYRLTEKSFIARKTAARNIGL
jgi:hypothetical protein